MGILRLSKSPSYLLIFLSSEHKLSFLQTNTMGNSGDKYQQLQGDVTQPCDVTPHSVMEDMAEFLANLYSVPPNEATPRSVVDVVEFCSKNELGIQVDIPGAV